MQTTATELTPIQLTLLDSVMRGDSIETAAKATELRWAVIMEWNRAIPEFRLALEQALECRALLNRERAQEFAYEALMVLLKILQDEKASASVRLRASLAVIKMSTGNPEAKRKPTPKTAEKTENVHNSAQAQPVRLPVQPGRNSVCPCGSGTKFKRCCGNPVPNTATAEPAAA